MGGSCCRNGRGKRYGAWGLRKPTARKNGCSVDFRLAAPRRSLSKASSVMTLSASWCWVAGSSTTPLTEASTTQSSSSSMLQSHWVATELTRRMDRPSLHDGGSMFGGRPGPFSSGTRLPQPPSSVWKIFPVDIVSQPRLRKYCGSDSSLARSSEPDTPDTAPSSSTPGFHPLQSMTHDILPLWYRQAAHAGSSVQSVPHWSWAPQEPGPQPLISTVLSTVPRID